MLTNEDLELLRKVDSGPGIHTRNNNNSNNNNNNNNIKNKITIQPPTTTTNNQFTMNSGGGYSPKSKTRNLKSNPMSYDDYEDQDDPIELELKKKMLNMLNQNSSSNNNNNNFSLHNHDNNNNNNDNYSSDQDVASSTSYSDNYSRGSGSNHSDNITDLYNNFNNDHIYHNTLQLNNNKSLLNKQHNRSVSVNINNNNNNSSQMSSSHKSFLNTSNPGFSPPPQPQPFGSPKLSYNIPTTTSSSSSPQSTSLNLNTSINGTSLATEELFNLNDKYLVCERDRIKSLSKEFKFEICNERVVIKEYKLYAVEEWIFKSNHIWSSISYTGNPDDKVIVLSLKPTTQNKQFFSLIAKPPNNTFYSINTKDGQLLKSNSSLNSSVSNSNIGLTLVEIPDGDFDLHINDLKTNLCLKRLGCTDSRYPISYNKLSDCISFRKLSGFPKVSTNYVSDFVKELQAALSHLNYLPLLTKIDGWYDQKTINALKAFQIDSNKKKDGGGGRNLSNSVSTTTTTTTTTTTSTTTSPLLPIEGYLDQNTFNELQEEINKLAQKLFSLGYSPPDNPIKNYQELNTIIKSFQEQYRIYPDAPGKNILNFIDKINFKIPIVNTNTNTTSTTTITATHTRNRSKSESSEDNNNNNNSNARNKVRHSKNSSIVGNKVSINNSISNIINNSRKNNNNSSVIDNKNQYGSIDDMESFKRGQEKTDAEIFRYDDDDDSDQDEDDEYYEDVEDGEEEYDEEQQEEDDDFYTQEETFSNADVKSDTTTNGADIEPKNALSQTQNDINNLETFTEAEEKEKLKQTILKLEGLVDKQTQQYKQLKDDFNQLYDSYYELKEKSLKSIAIISTNEKMFGEINNRWNKLTRKELPEIEDKINTNVDIIQSYSNKMKRLDDIVTSIQRKNDRNIFISFLMSIGSLLAIIFAYALVFVTKIKRKLAVVLVPINNSSNKNSNSDENIEEFVIKQKLRITQLMDDYDDVNSNGGSGGGK